MIYGMKINKEIKKSHVYSQDVVQHETGVCNYGNIYYINYDFLIRKTIYIVKREVRQSNYQ